MVYSTTNKMMGSKVVSTKLTEEEYGKLVGLCSASGYTVSKLLKRAILARMNEEAYREYIPTPKHVTKAEPQVIHEYQIKKTAGSEDKFLYY
ncbi:MAG: hypothetical protein XU09_C0009G0002 [Thaumarchaeota archaeon CSP1-1]|nr:MAG: hypothetical protein XU09_C0009G0002 [Thaumarchaeota archaeon CSP1-1]